MGPRRAHEALFRPQCSPASWGMPSSHCGPGECRLTVKVQLTSWSPCVLLPSQCPRTQISQLLETSYKRGHEPCWERQGSPTARDGLAPIAEGFIQPNPHTWPIPAIPGPPFHRAYRLCIQHLTSSPLTPLPDLSFPLPWKAELCRGEQQLMCKGLPFCRACPCLLPFQA